MIQKREKFILQGNLQSLGKKCGILTAVYLLITGYLVGAASTGKRNDSTFAGAYKIRINNAVIRGKLDVFGGTIAVTDSSQISLTIFEISSIRGEYPMVSVPGASGTRTFSGEKTGGSSPEPELLF